MPESPKKLSYAASGVDYSKLDVVKRLAQDRAAGTAPMLIKRGMRELTASRGESAYVWEDNGQHWAFVIEGLGTKNLVADATRRITGKSHYDTIAQDAVASIVNDVIVVGAQPIVISAYFAVGDSDWMTDEERASDLITGWAKACQLSGAGWGGGETPTLKDVIMPGTIDLGGSCLGKIYHPKHLVLGDKLQAGDAIVLIESSGIHTNGFTLVRQLADSLPNGYATKLSNDQILGEALLRPTLIYAQLVEELLANNLDLHYMVHVTGHGWRKLMRATQTYTYRMTQLPPVDPVFDFIQKHAGVDDKEMYGNYNMGTGFAIMLPAESADQVIEVAKSVGLQAWNAGRVEAGPKRVVIEPKNITFESEDLAVR